MSKRTLPAGASGASARVSIARHAAVLAGVLLACSIVACGSKGKAKKQAPTIDPNAPILAKQGSPTGDPIGKSIGVAGGTLTSADGRLTVTIPSGALASNAAFSVQPVTITAIGGVGGAYRVKPEGVRLSKPVTMVFKGPPTYASGTSIADLGVAYQDASGFWFRVKEVQRDATANTLTVTSTHFSDWGVVWQSGVPGLYGSFTLNQTIGVPFSATGTSTLFYQGDNAQLTLYIATGSITVPTQLPWQGGTCAPAPGSVTGTIVPTVAEVWKSPAQFRWSVNGQWSLACTDSAGQPAPSQFMSSMFDSMGINLVGCTRGYVGAPLLGADHLQGTYTIDCGAQGKVTASWDLIPCIPGVKCASTTSACNEAVISCDTGQPVCTDTGRFLDPGTTCGTNMVCDPAGACISCTAGTTCTPTGSCTLWQTSCATGAQTCVDTTTPLGTGASCGTNMVCDPTGTCTACTAGLECTPAGSCTRWTTSCASGASVCTDTGQPLGTGASCGTNMVCSPTGTCVGCTADVTCTPAGSCTRWATSCASGGSVCTDTAQPLGTGATCGTNMVCDTTGTCVSCTSGVDCTPTGSCTRFLTSCSTGASVCVDTGQLLGTGATCGTNMVCSPTGTCVACTAGTTCTPTGACTLWQTSCGTGAETCLDTTNPLGTGTSCGTGMVCNGSQQCVSCVQGQDCTPAGACTQSRIDCSSGAPVCTATTDPVTAGTSCGAGLVCNGSGGCVSCTQDLLCTPPGSCFEYRTDCSTGTSVCNPTTTPVAAGTSCGSNLVCNGAGACVSCAEGADCTPVGACTQSRISCASGAEVCTATTDPVTAGTSCGQGLVCNGAGSCVSCVAGAICTPSGVCTKYETSCSTGAQTCVDTGTPLGTGASCGTNLVCDPNGQCVTCNQGADCTPFGACVQSQIACNTGGPVCTATTSPVTAGTPCGNNQVCNGAGSCVDCAAGIACTPTGSCTLWQTSCSTGTQTCVDTGQTLADGTSCGTLLNCSAGSCGCVPGTTCAGNDACHTGAVACDTNPPTCAQTAVAPGTSCGTGLVCDATAACVCNQGGDCTPAGACLVSQFDCGTGVPICTQTSTALPDGTACGPSLTQACVGGVCQ